jgi:sugar lactone lactonase YvrE
MQGEGMPPVGRTATRLLGGLHFAEGPSVGPDGNLYVSDFYAHEVLRVDLGAAVTERVAFVPGQPSGLGWLPDSRMLIVSMRDQRLLRLEPDGSLAVHADLAPHIKGSANDMHVDAHGRAFVGCFGFDFYALLEAEPDADPLFGPGANPPGAVIVRVDPDGSVTEVAQGLGFPNGTVQLSDGTLIVAETVRACVTAFAISADGFLTDRRQWLDLEGRGPEGGTILPDGICVDREDAIWVSDPTSGAAVRFDPAGAVTDVVRTSLPCFAVGLAGPDRRTLVCCTAETSNPNTAATHKTGWLEIAEVPVPGRLTV